MRDRYGTMDSRVLLVLCLLCDLEVDSQTFPRLTFGNDDVIPNHGYVDLGTMGTGFADSVQCRTDLSSCCTSQHHGQWYYPDGQFVSSDTDIHEIQKSKRVDLRRRNNPTSPTGIYRCEIPTNAVNDDTDTSVRASVYVGLYTSAGKWLK